MMMIGVAYYFNPLCTTTSSPSTKFHYKNLHYKDSIFTFGSPVHPRQCQYSSTHYVSCLSASSGDSFPHQNHQELSNVNNQEKKGVWQKWKENSVEMSSKLAKLGLAAVLTYGIFDGITYTSFFMLAFLGYEKSTGNNPAANLQALIGIVILMWTGNNVTRPFRVAGAAALAPMIDSGLRIIQKYFNFPSLVYAFALVAGIIAGSCLTIIGLLILSRWGK